MEDKAPRVPQQEEEKKERPPQNAEEFKRAAAAARRERSGSEGDESLAWELDSFPACFAAPVNVRRHDGEMTVGSIAPATPVPAAVSASPASVRLPRRRVATLRVVPRGVFTASSVFVRLGEVDGRDRMSRTSRDISIFIDADSHSPLKTPGRWIERTSTIKVRGTRWRFVRECHGCRLRWVAYYMGRCFPCQWVHVPAVLHRIEDHVLLGLPVTDRDINRMMRLISL